MNSGKIVAGRVDGRTGGESKVLQDVLADLKRDVLYKNQRQQFSVLVRDDGSKKNY